MSQKLGTFLGVFTPTILTILGVIMYLRFGWLVGHMGLSRVLLIVLLANAITIITTLSFSAVATNVKVRAGGAYYIVSRSLGLEIGGAIGLPLFLSQAFSVTLYAFGLAESFRIVSPDLPLVPVAMGIIVLVAGLAFVGADWALKSQVPLMGLVGISLVALTLGALWNPFTREPLSFGPSGEVGFWAGFAIFFPAVTGVMAGLGLSGDLRDPMKAIPRGSLLAVLTGLAVYLVVPVILAMGASPDVLRSEPVAWSKIAVLGPWLVLPGLWAAIFSSAVGSMLAAPRTLQALARDGLAPRFLGHYPREGRTDGRELLPGMIVSVAIAMVAALLGNLNAVAAVVSMFFLTVYGTMNLVAAFENLSGDPSWRPRLRAPWPVCLLGGLGCVATMFLIDPKAGVVAVVAEALIWLVISRRENTSRWGDARRGLYETLVRWALVQLDARPLSARNWRPHVLVFVDGIERELELVRYGNWFSQRRGVVTVCQLVVGDLHDDDLELPARRAEMRETLEREDLVVFAEVDVVGELVEGLVNVSQANGMAGLSSNTLLLGWPADMALRVQFLRAMRAFEALNKSLLLGRVRENERLATPARDRRIHVWWGGLQRNGDLMLLLAWLLTRNTFWREARVEVLSLATTEMARVHTEQYLQKLIPEIRIEADFRVIEKPRDMSVAEMIQTTSADATLVFLGLATPEPGEEETYAQRLENLVGDLPNVFFVKNSSLFIGGLLEADETGDTPPAAENGERAPAAE